MCSRDCPDACLMRAELDQGRVVRLAGDEGNPYTRGTLCAPQERYLERIYHPYRVRYPHVKRADTHTSWIHTDLGPMLRDLAHRVTAAVASHGPLSILHVQGPESRGLASRLNALFFRQLGGTSTLLEDGSRDPGALAIRQDFGALDASDPRELLNSRLIVLWSHNPFLRNEHLLPFLAHAHKKGAKIVLVDPVHSPAAKVADAYYQVRPGSEGALALCLAHFVAKHRLADAAFLHEKVENAGEFLSFVQGVKPEPLAAAADLPLTTVENLARLIAGEKPAAMVLGETLAAWPHAGSTFRLLNALAVMTGQIGVPGAGVFYRNEPKGLDFSFLEKTPLKQERALSLQDLMDGKYPADPPIQVAFINRWNPAYDLPSGERFLQFLRTVPTVVVSDLFFTDTCDAATHFLPLASALEEEDLVVSAWHKGIGAAHEVIAPRGEARSDFFYYRRLSRLLDFKEMDRPLGAFLHAMIGRLRAQGVTLERLASKMLLNPLETKVAFAGRQFPTPTGKVTLITHVDPPPAGPGRDFPLLLHPLPHRDHGTLQPLPEEDEPLPRAASHPDVLAALDLAAGDPAAVVSPHGRIRVAVEADPNQRRDVLLVSRGGSTLSGLNVMGLLPYRGAVLFGQPVRLEKA
jgi:anaerobic selenocysteine-containing dehydrogenase